MSKFAWGGMNVAVNLAGQTDMPEYIDSPFTVGPDITGSQLEDQSRQIYRKAYRLSSVLSLDAGKSPEIVEKILQFKAEIREFLHWTSEHLYVPVQRGRSREQWGDSYLELRSYAMDTYRKIWAIFADLADRTDSVGTEDAGKVQAINKLLFRLTEKEREFLSR